MKCILFFIQEIVRVMEIVMYRWIPWVREIVRLRELILWLKPNITSLFGPMEGPEPKAVHI